MDESFRRQAFRVVGAASLCFIPCPARGNVKNQDCSLYFALLHHLINHRIRVTIDRVPISSIIPLELGNALRRVFRALELSNDDITYIVCLEEGTRESGINAVIEIADFSHTLFYPIREKGALLALVEVPADHAGQAR